MPERITPEGAQDPGGKAKDRFERKLAREFGSALAAQFARLMEKLDPNDPQMPPDSFWEAEAEIILAWLIPLLQEMAETGAKDTLASASFFGVDWALLNQEAADWASRYSFELVGGINTTSRNVLQRAISGFINTPGQTLEQLEAQIATSFGPNRAAAIAVTETTRAYAQGQTIITQELAADGINMVEIWQTNNDEIVCPICAPRHNKSKVEGNWYEPPPAHVNCRCWITHEWETQ